MGGQLSKLDEVSLVVRNFGDGLVFEDVLHDWFRFLGGKPGEVVVVDSGSNAQTQATYWKLFQEGLIDKLQIIQPTHEENNHERGYIQIYTAGSIASKPYLLWFNIDTLPYREGYDKCSLNFALMKRSTFMAAMHEYAGDYIASGFLGENPAAATDQSRFLLEVALEQYMQRHKVYTLCKVEDPNWTIFHTNTHEERLKKIREKYMARQDIERYMNAGFSEAEPIPERAVYYGQPSVKIGLVKKLRISFGETPVGLYWRQLKQKLSY
jgi:hypothetical protein